MYLIHIPAERAGVDHWLYFNDDPRGDGCTHQVVEGVDFTDLESRFIDRKASDSAKFPVLGRSGFRPNTYRVFPSRLSVPLDFEILEGFAFQFPTWSAFMETPVAKDSQWRPIQ